MTLMRSLRRARRRLMFLSVRTLLRSVGFERARSVGAWLGELQFRLAWRQRSRLQREIAQVLGRSPDDPAIAALLREAYRVNNGAVLEVMSLFDGRREDDEVAALCELDGLEHLRTALDGGRGAILLATHMGNVLLAAIRLVQAGWQVSVIYHEARMMSAGFFQSGLEQCRIQAILANAGIRAYGQMLAALKKGRIVFIMMDQGVKHAEDGLMQRFLGKDMAMPAGPAQLARASRSPVLPLVTTAATPTWRFAIQPAVALTGGSLESDVGLLADLTQRQVLQSPQWWSWHHRRWRLLPMAL
jgi:KDO2-lipid IV(A) lauroyltransferase